MTWRRSSGPDSGNLCDEPIPRVRLYVPSLCESRENRATGSARKSEPTSLLSGFGTLVWFSRRRLLRSCPDPSVECAFVASAETEVECLPSRATCAPAERVAGSKCPSERRLQSVPHSVRGVAGGIPFSKPQRSDGRRM